MILYSLCSKLIAKIWERGDITEKKSGIFKQTSRFFGCKMCPITPKKHLLLMQK